MISDIFVVISSWFRYDNTNYIDYYMLPKMDILLYRIISPDPPPLTAQLYPIVSAIKQGKYAHATRHNTLPAQLMRGGALTLRTED